MNKTLLLSLAFAGVVNAAESPVTFNNNILPILQTKCPPAEPPLGAAHSG